MKSELELQLRASVALLNKPNPKPSDRALSDRILNYGTLLEMKNAGLGYQDIMVIMVAAGDLHQLHRVKKYILHGVWEK